MSARPALSLALAVAAGGLTACGEARRPVAAPPRTTATATRPRPPRPPRIRRAHCPAAAGNCESATGEIIYLESKDPDGDGDLHLVVLGGHVTAPGVSVFDIGTRLRPRRDPRVGDLASAAGPVYRGSYGQRQIQATVLYLARRP